MKKKKKKIQDTPRGHHKFELLRSRRKLKIARHDLSTAIAKDGWMWSSSWKSKEWIRGPFIQRLPRSAHYHGQIPNCFCNWSPYLPTTQSWLINPTRGFFISSGKTGDGCFRTTQFRLDRAAQSCWDAAASFVPTA